jgi:Ca2+-binding EF-hand superfamily protein
MKNHPIRFLQLSVIAALAAVTPSFAGGTGTSVFTTADIDVSGSLSLAEFTTTLDIGLRQQLILKKFKDADRNDNLSLDLEEYLIFTGEVQAPTKDEEDFENGDVDVSGSLTFTEFAATFPGRRPLVKLRKIFLRADADASATISTEEWAAYRDGTWAQAETYTTFELADFDNDGELTPEEFGHTKAQGLAFSKVMLQFDKKDRNDDGILTSAELKGGANAAL